MLGGGGDVAADGIPVPGGVLGASQPDIFCWVFGGRTLSRGSANRSGSLAWAGLAAAQRGMLPPPTAGQKNAPPTAAPRAVPSSSPRLSCGPSLPAKQGPAAQVHAPARPLDEASRMGIPPNGQLADDERGNAHRTSPGTIIIRHLGRAVSNPPGSAPARVLRGSRRRGCLLPTWRGEPRACGAAAAVSAR